MGVVTVHILGTILAQLRIRISKVDHQAFNIGTKRADHFPFPFLFHLGQYFGSNLQVPGVIKLTCLQYSAG